MVDPLLPPTQIRKNPKNAHNHTTLTRKGDPFPEKDVALVGANLVGGSPSIVEARTPTRHTPLVPNEVAFGKSPVDMSYHEGTVNRPEANDLTVYSAKNG